MQSSQLTKPSRKPKTKIQSPFGQYFAYLDRFDTELKNTKEFGSFLILGLVEEVGEMARAYLAKHGRKPTNIAAQKDEKYEDELGDIIVAILRFARIKNIDLNKRIMYSLNKIKRRKSVPKE
jgi:NTP pyrophosphatase (non-canonical NTP hydrolase)